MSQYNISYQQNSVYQTILVDAKDEAHAKAYFESHKPTAEIIGCKVATSEDQRPGKPVLTVPEGWEAPEQKEEPKRTAEEVTAGIINFFEDNEDIYTEAMEELDSYNGYLGDDRYYDMDELDDLHNGIEPSELLRRAFFGYDEDTYTTDSSGDKIYGAFNPNRDYFRYNGYGNLVSADCKDYSALLDGWAVEAMSENRVYIDVIEDSDELSALFDELEGASE
ncbi:MAG: hypothetical protein ACI4JR_09530 [Acutalibacteraceae bacterium]